MASVSIHESDVAPLPSVRDLFTPDELRLADRDEPLTPARIQTLIRQNTFQCEDRPHVDPHTLIYVDVRWGGGIYLVGGEVASVGGEALLEAYPELTRPLLQTLFVRQTVCAMGGSSYLLVDAGAPLPPGVERAALSGIYVGGDAWASFRSLRGMAQLARRIAPLMLEGAGAASAAGAAGAASAAGGAGAAEAGDVQDVVGAFAGGLRRAAGAPGRAGGAGGASDAPPEIHSDILGRLAELEARVAQIEAQLRAR